MTRMGVSQRIQQSLDRGRDRDEVVQELVDSGLSRRGAEGMVDRALAARSEGRSRAGAGTPEDGEYGHGGLIAGAFWLSLGCTVTATTYLLAPPGGRYTAAYGAVVAGLLLFIRSFSRWSRQASAFPWVGVVITLALPPAATASLVVYARWRDDAREAARVEAAEAQRLAQEAAKKKEEAARQVLAQRAAAEAEQVARDRAAVNRARQAVDNPDQVVQICDAVRLVGRLGDRSDVPRLETLFREARMDFMKVCALSGLVSLGEFAGPLTTYDEWARGGDVELYRAALRGFGRIGPPALHVGLPHLTDALRSPMAPIRADAVESLENFGAPAEPLLQEATQDPDDYVRRAAVKALAKIAAARRQESAAGGGASSP